MPSKARKWKFRIQHILVAIDECQQFVAGMTYEQFSADVKTLKAVVWNLMMIGEAAGHVPAHIQSSSEKRPVRSQLYAEERPCPLGYHEI